MTTETKSAGVTEGQLAALLQEVAALRQQVAVLQSGALDDQPVTKIEPFREKSTRRIASMELVKGVKALTFRETEDDGGFMVHTYCGSTRVKSIDDLKIDGRIEHVG